MEKYDFRQIPLKNRGVETGKFAKCSPQHYDEIMKYNWGINELKGGYAETYGYLNKKISMHKYIITIIEKIEIPDGYLIDHKDTSDTDNQLNNCIDNLRLFTPAQNSRNQRKRKNCSSTLMGVYYQKKGKKYQSHFVFNGDNIYLGIFDSEIEAGMARDAYIVQNDLIKEGYSLNFKDKIDELKTYNIFKKPKLSKFKNVGKSNNYYVTRIVIENKQIFYYHSKSEIECAKKYDEFVVNNNLYKELNFPSEYPDFNPPKPVKIFKIDIDDKRCKIELYSSKEVIIDIESYEKVKYHKLIYNKNNNGYEYVSIRIDKKNYILSRYLMNEKNPKILIDHIDSNPLNNCLNNLRQSNYQRNSENKKKGKTQNPTNYVSVSKRGKKFRTKIQNQIFQYTKTHLTEEYAARDRDLQYLKRLPNSHYKIYFDWKIPGEIEKWEDLLFLEEIDMMFNKYKS
jgi:hypothetical protein